MKIFCIGRNYVEHAKELKNAVPEEPVFFMKPDTALINNNQAFYLPDFSKDIHHEVELVLRICKAGKHIAPAFAHKYYDQIGIGIDFTARDVQQLLKDKGLPWEKAKAFDGSAPLGQFLPVTAFSDLKNINFSLAVNGQVRQSGNSKDMIFHFDTIISHLSKYITLRNGDLIYTGTPAGVSAVKAGDKLNAYIGQQLLLSFDVK